MEEKTTRIDVRKVAAKYAARRANTLKDGYDDVAAQEELLRIAADTAQSRDKANKLLGVNQ